MQDVNLTLTRNEVMVGHSAVEDFSVNGRQHKEVTKCYYYSNDFTVM